MVRVLLHGRILTSDLPPGHQDNLGKHFAACIMRAFSKAFSDLRNCHSGSWASLIRDLEDKFYSIFSTSLPLWCRREYFPVWWTRAQPGIDVTSIHQVSSVTEYG